MLLGQGIYSNCFLGNELLMIKPRCYKLLGYKLDGWAVDGWMDGRMDKDIEQNWVDGQLAGWVGGGWLDGPDQ